MSCTGQQFSCAPPGLLSTVLSGAIPVQPTKHTNHPPGPSTHKTHLSKQPRIFKIQRSYRSPRSTDSNHHPTPYPLQKQSHLNLVQAQHRSPAQKDHGAPVPQISDPPQMTSLVSCHSQGSAEDGVGSPFQSSATM